MKYGNKYEHGFCDIVSKDIHKSIQMYQKASDQNYSPAMLNLGNLYLEGFEGVASDKEKAIQLFERASKLGNEEAKVQLEILKTNENKVNEIEIENINKKVEKEIIINLITFNRFYGRQINKKIFLNLKFQLFINF